MFLLFVFSFVLNEIKLEVVGAQIIPICIKLDYNQCRLKFPTNLAGLYLSNILKS